MTEMMMKPDEGLADRLLAMRYSVLSYHVGKLAGYDAVERSPLRCAAAGELVMSAAAAKEMLVGWRSTIGAFTAGISDDTLLDDLAAWIERCAKPPFDPAPVAEALIADIERVTREGLGELDADERVYVASELGATPAGDPYCKAAYNAVRSLNRDLG